jgi:hypothetical protein
MLMSSKATMEPAVPPRGRLSGPRDDVVFMTATKDRLRRPAERKRPPAKVPRQSASAPTIARPLSPGSTQPLVVLHGLVGHANSETSPTSCRGGCGSSSRTRRNSSGIRVARKGTRPVSIS